MENHDKDQIQDTENYTMLIELKIHPDGPPLRPPPPPLKNPPPDPDPPTAFCYRAKTDAFGTIQFNYLDSYNSTTHRWYPVLDSHLRQLFFNNHLWQFQAKADKIIHQREQQAQQLIKNLKRRKVGYHAAKSSEATTRGGTGTAGAKSAGVDADNRDSADNANTDNGHRSDNVKRPAELKTTGDRIFGL